VDKEFFSRAGSAIGEVRQFRIINDEIKKFLKQKKKKCAELTEWGTTVSKIVSISLIHKVDKIFLVKQRTQFFEDVLKELKKNKIDVEVVEVQQEEPEKKKGFFG
jgi:tRNA G18 (ribose-2'-O)-methylase SpoU